MAIIDQNPNLRLILPRSQKQEFYLYHLNLNEGLSQVSTAELTLFSHDTSIRMKNLKEMIGKMATVEMTQTMSNEESICKRWFSGMITEAVHCGIVSTNRERNTFKCGLRLQSPEVNMRYSKHRRSFVDTLPVEVIATIVKPYLFTCIVMNDVPASVTSWNEPDDFYQNSESDYDFFLHILRKYGLSYVMVTQKPSDGMPGSSTMVISNGNAYPTSAFEMPDIGRVIRCSCRNAEQNHLSIAHWRMSSKIGVEYAGVNFEDGSALVAQTIGEKRSMRQVFFNHSPLGELNKNNAEKIMTNYLRSMQQTNTCWEGDVIRLDVMPGRNMMIPDFYGDDDVVHARIVSDRVEFTAPWPTILLGDASEKAEAELNIHLHCMDLSEGIGFRTPFLATTGSAADKGNTGPVDFSSGDDIKTAVKNAEVVPFQAIQAVACDVSGNTGSDHDINHALPLRNDAYEFYACYKSGNRTEVVSVTMMMPLGGLGEGLFHVPRQGDKILIGCVNGTRYYLMGYLPDSSRPFMDGGLLNGLASNVNEMTVLRGNTPGRDPLSYIRDKCNVALGQMDRLESAGRDVSKQRPNHQFSEIGIYHNYNGQKK